MLQMQYALSLVNRAVEAATAQNVKIAAVVVDAGGNVVASARMDGAGFLSFDIARKKARTAATLGHATQDMAVMASKDPLMLSALAGEPEIMLLAGGVPIGSEGGAIGAIGVAGAHYLQDQAIADFAIAD